MISDPVVVVSNTTEDSTDWLNLLVTFVSSLVAPEEEEIEGVCLHMSVLLCMSMLVCVCEDVSVCVCVCRCVCASMLVLVSRDAQ